MADEEEQITDDIGGVQGAEDERTGDDVAPAPRLGETPDKPAPDAGEIEWSGGLIKKPPTPAA